MQELPSIQKLNIYTMSEKTWFIGVVFWLVGTLASAKNAIELKPEIQVDLAELGNHEKPNHSHQSVLDPGGVFTVYWTPDLIKQEVIWELHVRTLGWFGFGFSSNGNMRGADIMTAWVKDGRLFLQDRHGIGDTRPPLDDHADWRPLHARENDTHTVLVVARDINTCDHQDYLLTKETVRLIYAWSEEDPLHGNEPSYHGTKRGNRFALVLLPFQSAKMFEEVQTWSVSQKMLLPHDKDTFYWCHVEKVPKWEKKHHYVGFDMIHGQNSRAHLHHVVVFECHARDGSPTKKIFEKYVGHPGYECYTPNMPPDFYLCERFLINWAVGSEGEFLPENVGFPLGYLNGGADYLLIQTHYDNQPLYRDITVEWRMGIYYTDKLREQDASNMALGHSILFSLTVPPRTPHWLVTGHCSSDCTSKAIPEEGINVFMVFLHGHYLVRAIRLRHFRGDKELKPIAVDSYFDADFQQSRQLSEEVKILPGDHLTVECDYDSSDRRSGTYSGWSSRDEMCQAFISYYPRVDLSLCRSSPNLEVLKETYGIKSFPKDLDLYAFELDPEVGNGRRYQSYMNALPWDTFNMAALNEKIAWGEHAIKCEGSYDVKLELNTTSTRYPKANPYVYPEDWTCLFKGRPSITGHAEDPSGSHSHHDSAAEVNKGLLSLPSVVVLFSMVLFSMLK